MMKRLKSAGQRAVRRVASLPLRALGMTQCGLALDDLAACMVSEVQVPDGSVRFMTPTSLLQARARSALSKETDTIDWIERFASTDVFWDIGANIGVFSIYAALRRGVSVLAFEPSASNYMVLCRNIQINALNNHIVPYCIAMAEGTMLGVLNLSSHEMGTALHQFGSRGNTSRYWNGGTGGCDQGMIGYAVDDFIRQFRPPFPVHLKIDVDGLEWPILKGARQTLLDPRLRSIMAELNVSDQTELECSLSWLEQAGFELVSQGEIQESAGQAAANHFFARTRR